MAVSLAQKGRFTDFHEFQIIKPDNSVSKGWILLGVVLLLLLAVVGAVTYYCKHNLRLLIRNQNDTMVLMRDIEPTDFYEVSLNHKSFDELSDIME